MKHMPEEIQSIQVEITPIEPDTIASVRNDWLPLIQESLRQSGNEQLLTEGQITVEKEQTFPTDAAIVIGLTFLSKVAYDTWKAIILPRLQERFGVRHRPKPPETLHKSN